MANEFVARKGLTVLSGGAKITGSVQIEGTIIASEITGSFSGSIGNATLASTASYVEYTSVANKPALISSSLQFNNLSSAFTGSFTGSFTGDGSGLTGVASSLRITGSSGTDTISLVNEGLIVTSSTITTVVTNNTITLGLPNGVVTASSQVDHDATTNFVANEHIDHSTVSVTAGSGLTGGGNITATRTLTLDTGSVHFLDGVKKELNTEGVFSSSAQVDHDATTNFVANEHIDHSTVSITAGSGLSGGGNITATRTLSVDSGSMLPYYSSSIFTRVSGDITINSSTGVATIAANSVALGTDTTGNYAASISAGNGISVGGTAGEGTTFSVTLDTGSTHFTNGTTTVINNRGIFSSSAQVQLGSVTGTTFAAADFTFPQNLTVGGRLTAQEFYTELVSSSIIFESGSTKFGNSSDDIHSFQGTLNLTGSLSASAEARLNGGATISEIYFSSGTNTDVDIGTEIVAQVPVATYDSAVFDYVIRNVTTPVNRRAGTVIAVWDGTNIEFTEYSTADLGNTLGVVLSMDIVGGQARLKATVDSNDWFIKSAVRAL